MKRIKEEKQTNQEKKKIFTLKETLIISWVSCIITFVTVGLLVYSSYEKTAGISYNKLSDDKNLQEFLEVYSSVTEDYYEDIDKKELLTVAMDAMLEYLGEDYTTYLNESENVMINNQLNGKYIGIGISIKKDNTISNVFKNSPAMRAGLQKDDKILKIDGQEFAEDNTEEIVKYIKSKKDNTIELTVTRDEEIIVVELTPTSLDLPAATFTTIEKDDKKIAYLSISTFSKTVFEDVQDCLDKIKKENVSSLIVDLRNNTGGYLNSAKNVANLFLEKDKIIFSMKTKDKSVVYKDETTEKLEYPIIVLINGNTASAAEILTAALKESYGATLVGEKSYGKGKVQQLMNLSDGNAVKYTTAKWYTPSNVCIDKEGITPDYEIENEYNEETKVYKDKQLEKAIEIAK